MKRIGKLVLILSVVFVSGAWGQEAGCKFSPFWAEFHKENMERWNQCEHTLNVNNVGNLSVKWSSSVDSDGSEPAVADGVVYIGGGASVYALNAKTGVELWSYTTGNGVGSSPAVANGVVYIGSDDNNVYALNAKTGAKLWSYTTGDYVLSSPAVANGVVYVGSNDGNVYALNASTGTLL